MHTLLNDVDFAIAYLDDILIKSESWEQHTEHVTEVFVKIKQYGLELSLDKCEFSYLKSLGQIINTKGRKADLSKSSAIKNMLTPTNVSILQSSLGLANDYGNFIPYMNVLSASLNKLLKKIQNWTGEPNFRVLLRK